MQEHREVAEEIGPMLKAAMADKRDQLLKDGKDPGRTTVDGRVLTDDEIAASTEWLLERFQRGHTRNIKQEADEIRRQVGRAKFQAGDDS